MGEKCFGLFSIQNQTHLFQICFETGGPIKTFKDHCLIIVAGINVLIIKFSSHLKDNDNIIFDRCLSAAVKVLGEGVDNSVQKLNHKEWRNCSDRKQP